MGFWLDSGAPAIMQTLLNISAVEYAAIAAGQRNITQSDGIVLAKWMLDDLWNSVTSLIPTFEAGLPLPIQAVILDIAYNVGVGMSSPIIQTSTSTTFVGLIVTMYESHKCMVNMNDANRWLETTICHIYDVCRCA
jgi:hypothetical protein